MKVRLKQNYEQLIKELDGQFQFHEGPIKTQNSMLHDFVLNMFQFHEGPIKTGTFLK